MVSIENKRININNAPRWFKALMLLSVFIGAVLIKTEIDADMYFLLPTGKYILENGFFEHALFYGYNSSAMAE